MTGGAALARSLRACGVRDLYGVPAGKLGPFLKAVSEDPWFRTTGTRHEASAAWMATATFQATGRVAVCFGESGPGSLNLLSGLGSAHNNHLAALVITPGPPTHAAHAGDAVMGIDNAGLFAAVTKWSGVARSPEEIPGLVRRALSEALGGAPGPVHLELPADVLRAAGAPAGPGDDRPPVPAARATADGGAVATAAALLARAERPLLIAGGGVVTSDAAGEFRSLATRLGAAATTTQMGLGVVPTTSPAFFGHGGILGGDACMRAFAEADVVLAVGTRLSSWMWSHSTSLVSTRPGQQLIHADIDADVIGRNAEVTVGLQGDARALLAQLLAALPGEPTASDRRWLESLVRDHREARRALIAEIDAAEGAMHPGALAAEIAAHLPDDALVVFDGGHTSFWSNEFTPATEPRTRFHEPGMAHLGFGIPYALALKGHFPQRAVVNITGDGAFGFTLPELDTARRSGLTAVHVISNNASWGVIRLGQSAAGFELGTELEGTDYAAIARAFGCHGERIDRRDEVGPALGRAFASGLPAVIDAQVGFVPHPAMRRFVTADQAPPPATAATETAQPDDGRRRP